ncbi:MAG: AMP-binding protein, partial [Pseudomonadota bacterium]|nr:AMP-binding protein [Pseudomonadota bacterium]
SPRDLLRTLLAADAGGASRGIMLEKLTCSDQITSAAGHAETLLEVLAWHVQSHPQNVHINLYIEGALQEKITFRALMEGAESVACGLRHQGLEVGRTVALMLPTSRDYFYSFFGVLLVGAIPVPLYPPARPAQIEEHLTRHIGILKNSQAALLITVPEVLPLARLLKAQVKTLRGSVTVAELAAHDGPFVPHIAKPGDTAFLQYTSGSTGNPKGVVLSHANLLANLRAMGGRIKVSSSDVFVSWLPLYHDMGLIGAWFGSLYYGYQLVIMSPLSFLLHPESWLWAMHRHRGTLSAAPNFGYELCLKKIDDRDIEGLDLSSWRLAFNGAEPVSPETVRNFGKRFGCYGFGSEVMAPVYGLAESSVGLAFPPPGRRVPIDRIAREPFMRFGRAEPASVGDAKALRFVACGLPLKDHQIRIVDAQGREQGERQEGRLLFSGPSVTSGYYRNAEQNRRLFQGKWLDSGDLAYIGDGDVYITSRVKDIIIRGGRNIYPYELEEAVGKITGIRKGCVVAFGSLDRRSQTERLIVLAETREAAVERLSSLHSEINNLTTDILGLPPDDVLLLPPHAILKTSSGKPRRAATRDLYEEGRLGKGQRAVWWQLFRVALAGLLPQILRGLQALGSYLYAGYVWGLFLLLAPPVWMLLLVLPKFGWRWALLQQSARLLARLSATPLVVRGLENLPHEGSVVLVANHSSYLDGLVLIAALPLPFSFVVKAELKESLLFRLPLARIGAEFVERFDVEQGVSGARRLTRAGVSGRSLLFFPEGTFHRLPGLLPFRMGAFVTAATAAHPVVPVILRGTRQKLSPGSWLPRPGMVAVTIAKPIQPQDADWAAAVALRDGVREEILHHCGEVDLADTRPPVRGKKR